MEGSEHLQELFEMVASQVGPAVVRIGKGGRGAGVVVAGGRVLTNAHNLRDRTTTVTFADGRSVQGRVLGADVDGDLAVLDTGEDGPAGVTWEPGAAVPRLGQVVLVPTRTADGSVRVTTGYVSAVGRTFRGPRGRRIGGGFEHTAPLGPGSSGGPVVDTSGRLLGIDTHRLEGGFYLAVVAGTDLATRVDQLGRGESPRRVRLGVGIAPPEVARKLRRAVGLPERDGLLVRSVEDGSPAERAGIREGDLLVRVGTRDLGAVDDLLDALGDLGGATSVAVTLVRGAEDVVVDVELEQAPDAGATDGDGEAGASTAPAGADS